MLERVIYLAKSKGTVYTLLGKVSEQSGFLFVYDKKLVISLFALFFLPPCSSVCRAEGIAPIVGALSILYPDKKISRIYEYDKYGTDRKLLKYYSIDFE